MIDCTPDESQLYCARCGWKKPAKIKGWPRAKCPEPITEEEIARRRGICLNCCDWLIDGCRLIPEIERQQLTALKQRQGHCARICGQGKPKW